MTIIRMFLGIALALPWLSTITAEAAWRAGVAKVEITPDQPMWMAGYASRTRPAEGKLTPLWAKALVLEDEGKQRAVLITLDLIGIDRDLALSIRRAVAGKLRLELAQVMICTSHTHSGPVVARNLRPMHYLVLDEAQQRRVDRYAQSLEYLVIQLVDVARMRLAPCEMRHGSGVCTVAVNRRNNPEGEVPGLRAAGQLAGPKDHDVPVLAIHNADGELIGVVFGYACHATVLSDYVWSGDYPGYAQAALEKAHPQAIALFWAGCGGDQNPLPRRDVELARRYGAELAASVDQVLGSDMRPVRGALATHYAEIELPFGTLPTRDELAAQANDTNRYVATRAKYFLAELEAGRALPSAYPYPIARWRVGDEIDWLFLGGEVVVDYALRLKEERGQRQTWVAAYTNDVMAYIPSRRVLTEGGYEGGGAMVYYGLPTVWHEEVEEKIVSGLNRWK